MDVGRCVSRDQLRRSSMAGCMDGDELAESLGLLNLKNCWTQLSIVSAQVVASPCLPRYKVPYPGMATLEIGRRQER